MEQEIPKRKRGRPKTKISDKALKTLHTLGKSENKPDVDFDKLQMLIASQNAKIKELEEKISLQKERPIKDGIQSQVRIGDMKKASLMSGEEVKRFERQREIVLNELKGNKTLLYEAGGGDYKVFEKRTGSKGDLKNRLIQANRALALESPPTLTPSERDNLLRRYKELTEELRPLVASERDHWDVKNEHGHFQDAVDKTIALHTTYKSKLREWQNIGKTLDPNNKKLWNLNSLRTKYTN